MKRANLDETLRCSFCHKSQNTVDKLISSPSDYPRAYICDECITICYSILEDEREGKEPSGTPAPVPGFEVLDVFAPRLVNHARFSTEKMGKVDLFRGETLFAGLNCFEPGQEHAPHAHAGQDKLYMVLKGEGEVRVGGETKIVSAGDAAFAPSGVLHSIRNTGTGRLVVMAVLAPPPGK